MLDAVCLFVCFQYFIGTKCTEFISGTLSHQVTIKLQALCNHHIYFIHTIVGWCTLSLIKYWFVKVTVIHSSQYKCNCPYTAASSAQLMHILLNGKTAIGWTFPNARIPSPSEVPGRLHPPLEHPALVAPPLPFEESCPPGFGALAKSLSSLITDHC